MGREFLSEVIEMFWKYILAVVVQLCEYTKNQQIVHFK